MEPVPINTFRNPASPLHVVQKNPPALLLMKRMQGTFLFQHKYRASYKYHPLLVMGSHLLFHLNIALVRNSTFARFLDFVFVPPATFVTIYFPFVIGFA